MFIAHLPAGYLLTRWIQKRLHTDSYLWAGLIASIVPDLDLFYFYFIDHRQTLHHHYWTHLPFFWLLIGGVLILFSLIFKRRGILVLSTIFFTNIFLHLVLDTFTGGVNWLYPFIDHDLFLVTVPATRSFWVWSFVFHWSFLIELAITSWGICSFIRDRGQQKQRARTR